VTAPNRGHTWDDDTGDAAACMTGMSVFQKCLKLTQLIIVLIVVLIPIVRIILDTEKFTLIN